ncbi:MAG: hypothetical protein ABW321_34600 [Polyangiales bacterium]
MTTTSSDREQASCCAQGPRASCACATQRNNQAEPAARGCCCGDQCTCGSTCTCPNGCGCGA